MFIVNVASWNCPNNQLKGVAVTARIRLNEKQGANKKLINFVWPIYIIKIYIIGRSHI